HLACPRRASPAAVATAPTGSAAWRARQAWAGCPRWSFRGSARCPPLVFVPSRRPVALHRVDDAVGTLFKLRRNDGEGVGHPALLDDGVAHEAIAELESRERLHVDREVDAAAGEPEEPIHAANLDDAAPRQDVVADAGHAQTSSADLDHGLAATDMHRCLVQEK